MVFGDGPDGGREATFSGQVPYPGQGERWSGEIVLQAKYKQKPHRDYRDSDWLVTQLVGEVDRLQSLTKVPEYYVLVTNIRLSGVLGAERKGGQQKVDEAFAEHLAPLGVKALHVWHEEKVASLLDLYPDLFRSYRAWLAPRELLGAVFDSISAQAPDFGQTMLRYLQREIRDQRATRLQQAGHADDVPTPLETVFVDLPFALSHEQADEWIDLSEHTIGDAGDTGLLRHLLSLMSVKLDPKTLQNTWPLGRGPSPARNIILGGPGQGKSTITQFLAQVARTRLLLDQPQHILTPEARPIVAAVKQRLEELDISIEGVRRYPIQIDLPGYADALSASVASESPLSLLEWITKQISKKATAPNLEVQHLRSWLAHYPWLLILDGLDEVPSSGNRTEVLKAIADFWDEATPVNADVALVVTTRPQGYNDDLDPRLHVRLEMSRLDGVTALEYARKVVSFKIQDEDRGRRILERLESAAANATTAALMISPLQVAILLHLVDQRGTAPTDRWTLFSEYYSVVVKREQEKEGETSKVIRARALLVEGLLRRAGLLLHLEAEKRGGAEAFLSRDRFEELAQGLLEEEGHNAETAKLIVQEITTAVTDRLVFLEQRTEGRIEFDVRSLQEFMAAAELMEGPDEEVAARLVTIAGPTHWQHVYRIAASKAFSVRDAVKYRDVIITANLSSEVSGPGPKAFKKAARLALELLADGVAHDQPRYRRLLLEQALLLSTLDNPSPDIRLVDALTSTDAATAKDLIKPHLSSFNEKARRGFWRLLLACVRKEGDWADELVVESWPREAAERVAIATFGTRLPDHSNALKLVGEAIDSESPRVVGERVQRVKQRFRDDLDLGLAARRPILSAFGIRPVKGRLEVGLLEPRNAQMRLILVTLEGARRTGILERPDKPQWQSLNPLRSFVEEPSKTRLSSYTRSLLDKEVLHVCRMIATPWMVSTVTSLVEHGASAEQLADEIEDGKLGDVENWISAERRLQSRGMTQSDLDLWKDGIFFAENIADRGAPHARQLSMTVGSSKGWKKHASALLSALAAAPLGKSPTDQLKRIVSFALTHEWTKFSLSAKSLQNLILEDAGSERYNSTTHIAALKPAQRLDPSLLRTLSQVGKEGRFLVGPPEPPMKAADILKMVQKSDEEGILSFACATFASTPSDMREVAAAVTDRLDTYLKCEAPLPATRVLGYSLAKVRSDEVLNAVFAVDQESMEQHALAALAENKEIDDKEAEVVLAGIVERAPPQTHGLRESALSALGTLLDKRTSGLEEHSAWERLGLPDHLHRMLRLS